MRAKRDVLFPLIADCVDPKKAPQPDGQLMVPDFRMRIITLEFVLSDERGFRHVTARKRV